jgi:RHS repeat-associated protein
MPSSFSNPALTNPTLDASNNRMASGQNWTYDSAGNVTGEPEGRTFIYDAENKQVKVETIDHNGNPIATIGEYAYDGDGKRVKKHVPLTGETTIFVYDASNRLVAEYSTAAGPAATAKTSYLTTDHLGSPRILTDQLGQVISRRDFHPFGEEIFTTERTAALGYQPDGVRQKFTGYERDAETGLDFAQARMYANKLGRFTTVDPVAPDIFTPPSLNRYQYCLNNPLRFVDAGGGYDEEVHRDLTAVLAYVSWV